MFSALRVPFSKLSIKMVLHSEGEAKGLWTQKIQKKTRPNLTPYTLELVNDEIEKTLAYTKIIKSILHLFLKIYLIREREMPKQNYKMFYYLNEKRRLCKSHPFLQSIHVLFQIKLADSGKKSFQCYCLISVILKVLYL